MTRDIDLFHSFTVMVWRYLAGGLTFQTPVGLNIQNATKFQQAWTWESCAKHLQSDLLPQNRKGHFFPLTLLEVLFVTFSRAGW